MKKFFVKLVNWQAQRSNNAARIHDADQKDQADIARDELKNKMHARDDNKYVSGVTPPTDDEVTGPSESKTEQA